MRPHECRLLRRTFGVAAAGRHHDVREPGEGNGDQQLEVLRVSPAKWRGGSIWPAETQSPAGNVRPVPDLFRNHQSLPGETFDGADQLSCRQSHREEVTRALAGQNRPRPPAAAAVPRRSILVLAVAITDVPPPAGARGQADLQRSVDALKAAEDSLILRPPQSIADQLEKLWRDRAFGRAVVGVAGQAHVDARGGGAPGFDAVVPVIGDSSKVARRHVLAGLVGKFRGDD